MAGLSSSVGQATARVEEITPATAGLVPPLIARVGGTGFGIGLTDPEAVAAAVESGKSRFFVAVDERGAARGIIGLGFRFPTRALAYVGAIAVDPELSIVARGGVLRALIAAVIDETRYLAAHDELRCLVSSETTEHQMTQRLVEHAGFVTTGVYLGEGRANETISVRALVRGVVPYAVAPPRRFATELSRLYTALRLPVTLAAPERARGQTRIEERLVPRRRRSIIEATELGEDAPEAIRARIEARREDGVASTHVLLPLTLADLDPCVEVLIGAGFRYAALLPCFRGHDVLALQRLEGVVSTLDEQDLHAPLTRLLLRGTIRESGT